MLFFLSIIVIAVGVIGIITQKNTATPHETSIKQTKAAKKTIVIAEATHSLTPREILRAEDYKLRTIEIDDNQKDIRDISLLGTKNLTGYLVRNNISQDSSILPTFIEAPTSKTFVIHSLKADELPYGYQVGEDDAYLLSSLAVGDRVSLYIRLIEVEKDKKDKIGLVPEGSINPDAQMKKYTLNRISDPISILQVNEQKKLSTAGRAYGQKNIVGTIVLRMNRKQLANLRVVEKAGDILLFPVTRDQDNVTVKMDEVLPQLRSVKELRGGK
ncbi:pilus assembly protein CpaB [Escherichia alba]|uniref:Pilus assembly protein CpaB n=2 Tax=Intestinirhabdus alba TaxID=2899544 RepID=A0A6L6IFG4_9ENTR|nr:pilus assembly protein CpaB [Intestinirhabdus alba]